MKLKIMTYNIQHFHNYTTKQIEYDSVADVIRKEGAEIVVLNEVMSHANDGEYPNQAEELAKRLGYYCCFAQGYDFPHGPYGNAIISKYPFSSIETFVVPDPVVRRNPDGYYETRGMFKAKFESGLTIIGTHFGLNSDEQENSVKMLMRLAEPEKCVFMGDFNVYRDNPIIAPIFDKMHDASVGFCETERSYPSDSDEDLIKKGLNEKEPCGKIDYIFTTHDIKVLSADIPHYTVSDHRPHTAVIEF